MLNSTAIRVDQQGRDADHDAGYRQAVAFFAGLLDLVDCRSCRSTMVTIEPMQQNMPTMQATSETIAMVFVPGCIASVTAAITRVVVRRRVVAARIRGRMGPAWVAAADGCGGRRSRRRVLRHRADIRAVCSRRRIPAAWSAGSRPPSQAGSRSGVTGRAGNPPGAGIRLTGDDDGEAQGASKSAAQGAACRLTGTQPRGRCPRRRSRRELSW